VVVGAVNISDTFAGCDVFESVLGKYPSVLGVVGMRLLWDFFVVCFGFG